MAKMIVVNLPVADVAESIAFYEAIGFEKNAAFSGEHAASMMWSDSIMVMLAARPFFATLTDKTIADARTSTTSLFALSFDSRAEVDAITEAAVTAGGRELHDAEDEGFMYSRAFEDLDGHGFGPFWMNPGAAQEGPAERAGTAG